MSAAATTELAALPHCPSSQTFFDNLDSFAESPEGVKKLRELILDLAVRGKLVEQDENDEPASELVNRATEERSRPTNGKKVSSSNLLSPVGSDEMTFELPRNWAWVRMSHIAGHRLGKMLDKSKNKGKLYPYLRNTNVQWLEFNLDDIKEMRFEEDELDEYEVREGDLLICEGGEPGRCAIWQRRSERVMFQKAIHRVRPLAGIESQFLQYLLLADARNGNLDRHFTGATIKHFTGKELARYVVALPPLPEQRRIVSKVDSLMSLCDELESNNAERVRLRERASRSCLERLVNSRSPKSKDTDDLASAWQRLSDHFEVLYDIPKTLAQLRQSILQLAVQGKLVPQDPNDEAASELLERIAKEIAWAVESKAMRKPKPIPEYEGELPFSLPPGWEWAQLGQLVAVEDNAMCDGPFGSKLKTKHYIPTPGYAVIRLGNIGIGDFIWGKEGHIARDHFESLSGNHVRAGDLIVAGMADPIARCCEVPDSLGPAVNKADCFRIRVHREINRDYLRYFMNSPIAREFAAGDHHGMTRQRINLTNAKSMPVSLPPLAEQKRIVAKVDQLLSQCDELSARLRDRQSATHGLLTATIQELLNRST